MKILAIETSCDETAIAILNIHLDVQRPSGRWTSIEPAFSLLSNVVLSQMKIHKPFGGVVPNLAQREHQKNLPFILKTALCEAGFSISKSEFLVSKQISKSKSQKIKKIFEKEQELLRLFQKHILPLKSPPIDAIAVTYGPGLEPALWVGVNFARALALLWKKPLIPVNHLEGHIYASWLAHTSQEANSKFKIQNSKQIQKIKTKNQTLRPKTVNYKLPTFPVLALIVSGGHTELVLVKNHLQYRILGETRDDAAGEAFDKVAKMLGLGYPGGPEISKLAERGNPKAVIFPRPMINSKDFDFSFSGLKTAVLYFIRDKKLLDENSRRGHAARNKFLPLARGVKEFSDKSFLSKKDIAASFEQAVVDVLISKTAKALRQYGAKSLVVGGGVAANKKLRNSFEHLIAEHYPSVILHLSPLWLCGDNAAMIAVTAYFHALKKKKINTETLRAKGNLKL